MQPPEVLAVALGQGLLRVRVQVGRQLGQGGPEAEAHDPADAIVGRRLAAYCAEAVLDRGGDGGAAIHQRPVHVPDRQRPAHRRQRWPKGSGSASCSSKPKRSKPAFSSGLIGASMIKVPREG